VFESFVEPVAASEWVYVLVLAIAALDAVFPLVPSEATIIAAVALAGSGEPSVLFILLSGAAGAIIGDNVAYVLGRAGGGVLPARVFRSTTGRRRLGLARAQLQRRGGTIIVVSRFVPGRTVAMLSAGIVGLAWRRFIRYDVVACLLWAGYASLIGWVGGKTFADEPVHSVLLAFALALVLALLIEGGRRLHARSACLKG
jgi:membrane protein DedA with SNARE-associated domain